jgi:hypothetical protein
MLLTEATTMIVISILASIAAIGVICCLLFHLAVYALPLFAGVTAGVWAYGTALAGSEDRWDHCRSRNAPHRPLAAHLR